MKAISLLLSLVLLSGCTAVAPPIPTPPDLGAECKTVECMVLETDIYLMGLEGKYQDRRYDFMRGYPEVSLLEMYMTDRLVIEEISPEKFAAILAVSIAVTAGNVPVLLFGYAEPVAGKYGDMYSCELSYLETDEYHWLIHELLHCAGYHESTLWITDFMFGITKSQERILEIEQRDDWLDTSVYKIWQEGGWGAVNANERGGDNP